MSRRLRLKTATEALHRSLDNCVERSGFLDTLEGYRDYLIRTLTARSAIEAALDRGGAEEVYAPWPARRIAGALRQDLRDLGMEPSDAPPPLDGLSSRAGVLGALYVLEGSSIGARGIARRVATLGLDARSGARHLGVQTADPKAFVTVLRLLEAAELAAEDEAACLSAAVATFERFAHAYAA